MLNIFSEELELYQLSTFPAAGKHDNAWSSSRDLN
ncbi:hypothetical protein X798_02730 [Onchocerca flexuosa]|uniref:Uncharacterized protein n=1 Tax=Onchocerca flexuosa TaxID=387005 RepID=A0A238BZH9_9BILA|nr:hypothetical protein X798_02730 [Onchocerca flexuosa]